jgi:hypothetical protein
MLSVTSAMTEFKQDASVVTLPLTMPRSGGGVSPSRSSSPPPPPPEMEAAPLGRGAPNDLPDTPPVEEDERQLAGCDSNATNANHRSYLDWDDLNDDDDEASDIKSQAVFSVGTSTGMSATSASDIKSQAELISRSDENDMNSPAGSTSAQETVLDDGRVDRTDPGLPPEPLLDGSICADKIVDNRLGVACKGAEVGDATRAKPWAAATDHRVASDDPSSPPRREDNPSIDIVVHPEDFVHPEMMFEPLPQRSKDGNDWSNPPAEHDAETLVEKSSSEVLVGPKRSELPSSGQEAKEIVYIPPTTLPTGDGEAYVDTIHEVLALNSHPSDPPFLPASPRESRLGVVSATSRGEQDGDGRNHESFHCNGVDCDMLDTNSDGEEVPVASMMHETWCKELLRSGTLINAADDSSMADGDDQQSVISDLSDDRSSAIVDIDVALANAKMFGFKGDTSPTSKQVQPACPSSPTRIPTSPSKPTQRKYEPLLPVFNSQRTPPRPATKLLHTKAASFRLPRHFPEPLAAAESSPPYEPTIPSFRKPRGPALQHRRRDDSLQFPSRSSLQSRSQRSLFSNHSSSQRSVEIHLDIYVSPILEDAPAEVSLPVPRDSVTMRPASARSSSSSQSTSRFRRWPSFRSKSKRDTKSMTSSADSKSASKTKSLLRLPMLSTIPAEEDSVASSRESQRNDFDELEEHLHLEYGKEKNVLNTGYEDRDDLYERNFLTCPLEDVQATRNSATVQDELPPEVLTEAQETCCANLKRRWHEKYPKLPLSDEMILRFALCAPRGLFHEASAWKKMKRFDRRYLTLTAAGMEKQLLTKVSMDC